MAPPLDQPADPTGAAPPTPRSGLAGVALALGLVATLAALYLFVRVPRSADSLWNEARLAFEARDFPRAQGLVEQLGRARAPTAADRMLRAQVAIGLKRDDDALAELRQVPDSYSLAAVARLEAGQIERSRDRFDAAEAALNEAVRLDPKQIKARRELIYIYGIELRRADLDRMFRELAELSQLDGPEVFLWSLSKGLTWDAEENSQTLRKVVDAEPTNRRARLSLAEALLTLSRFDEAEATIRPLPDADPAARALRAQLALARGDAARVDALLAGGPEDDLDLALLRGKQALAQGDPEAALRHYRVAYRLGPQSREAVLGLAQALRLNRDPGAAALQERSRRLDVLQGLISKMAAVASRDDLPLIRQLGDACAAVGRTAEARSWYRLLVARDPFDTQAQAAINRLREPEPAPPAPESRP